MLHLKKEISEYKRKYDFFPKTIYFGGGTPSLLTADDVSHIVSQINPVKDCEITLEANPVTITEEYAASLRRTKINRISLGGQSFIDKELKLLGRLHNSKQITTAFNMLRDAGFENISLDLIYGLPNQTKEDINSSLNKIIELNPEHISTYCLSLDKDVPLFAKKSMIPEDETVSEFYYLIRERLLEAGYKHYEISNFAKPGKESRHNLSYWDDKGFLGFGPSAAGYVSFDSTKNGNEICDESEQSIFRYTNPAHMEKYIKSVSDADIEKNKEYLTEEEHEKEYIFLSLRKAEGISADEFKTKFKHDFAEKYAGVLQKYKKYIENEAGFYRLVPDAYFVSNEILAEFM